jgi:hypothetical protein
MTTVEIAGDKLVVTMRGADKVWALRSKLEFPLAHVASVRVDPNIEHEHRWRGIRAMGTSLPGVIRAGRFREQGKWIFWDVHNAQNAVVIELLDEHYSLVVVEVQDPAGTVGAIQQAKARG